ncbi:hypothetical protein BIFCAT_01205 [Bifidobacterium catenulatum DSM 16992 = JCM 1194 = LMG 11043]|uniref:Uncharacterized protein n=1 Tax=Bifidobacterium catenulatum DSM 16992 = JCM 1194 = LMG 11043 TaxID=566552 RepID=B6XVH6_9BIFI|nr:hypothetical protein BIFCAT_01205 [Bifidobacterium catenulatum DSM 16992 = JCM 1194 = LMG 11043]
MDAAPNSDSTRCQLESRARRAASSAGPQADERRAHPPYQASTP